MSDLCWSVRYPLFASVIYIKTYVSLQNFDLNASDPSPLDDLSFERTVSFVNKRLMTPVASRLTDSSAAMMHEMSASRWPS